MVSVSCLSAVALAVANPRFRGSQRNLLVRIPRCTAERARTVSGFPDRVNTEEDMRTVAMIV